MGKLDSLFRKLGIPDDIARIVQWTVFGLSTMVTALSWTLQAIQALPWPAQGAFGFGAFIVSSILLFLGFSGIRTLIRNSRMREVRTPVRSKGQPEQAARTEPESQPSATPRTRTIGVHTTDSARGTFKNFAIRDVDVGIQVGGEIDADGFDITGPRHPRERDSATTE